MGSFRPFNPRKFRQKKVHRFPQADWWYEPGKQPKPEPQPRAPWEPLHRYYVLFTDGSEVTFDTDCHMSSARYWASQYFKPRKVKDFDMVGFSREKPNYLHLIQMYVPEGIPHYMFRPKEREAWHAQMEQADPNWQYWADWDRETGMQFCRKLDPETGRMVPVDQPPSAV